MVSIAITLSCDTSIYWPSCITNDGADHSHSGKNCTTVHISNLFAGLPGKTAPLGLPGWTATARLLDIRVCQTSGTGQKNPDFWAARRVRLPDNTVQNCRAVSRTAGLHDVLDCWTAVSYTANSTDSFQFEQDQTVACTWIGYHHTSTSIELY